MNNGFVNLMQLSLGRVISKISGVDAIAQYAHHL